MMKIFFQQPRIIFWFVRGFINKHGRLLLSAFIAGFLIFLLVLKLFPLLPAFKAKTKRIAVIGAYTPTTLPLDLQNLMSIGLTSLGHDGEATNSLALNWEIKDEGKTYIFNLRSDLFWQDGIKFKSSDVNYNLKDVMFEPVTDEILKISLKEPFAPLPTILSRPIFKKGLIGLNPYKVDKIKLKGDKIVNLSLSPLTAQLAPLEFKFYSTEEMALTAFKLGEVDILDKISNINGLSSWPNVNVKSQTYFNYNVILFYNTRLPFFQKRTVRQALAYAIPLILDVDESLGPLNPNSWAYNADVKNFPPNLEEAKNILDKEGMATSSAEISLSTFPSFLPLAQKIASSWQSLGIKTKIKVESTLPANFDCLLVSQEIPADPDQYQLWHSTQSTNISGFASPKIDKLLEDGRKIFDKDKRLKIYQDFQKNLVEETPAVFLYHPKLYSVERK